MAYKPKAPDVMNEPNVIPMADIMLVLLIIFMVVTPMLQKGISVDLPRVNNPREMEEADKEDAVVIGITRDSRIYLGSQQIKKEDINQLVTDRLANKLSKVVFVRSDARAKYGDVVSVVDEVRSAGVDQLGLITERVQQQQRPGQPPTD